MDPPLSVTLEVAVDQRACIPGTSSEAPSPPTTAIIAFWVYRPSGRGRRWLRPVSRWHGGIVLSILVWVAALSVIFTDMANDSSALAPAEQERVADALEDDAEVMSNTKLAELLAGQPEEVRAEIVRINTEARPRAL